MAAYVRELSIVAPIELAEGEPAVLIQPAANSTNQAPDEDPTRTRWIVPEPRKILGFVDIQSPGEFIYRLESYCLIHSVKAEDRTARVAPAALDGIMRSSSSAMQTSSVAGPPTLRSLSVSFHQLTRKCGSRRNNANNPNTPSNTLNNLYLQSAATTKGSASL